MPLYTVQHCDVLTRSEKDSLASSIQRIHQSAFGAPSLFISICFEDVSNRDFYAGSKQQKCNRIFATLRTGGQRTVADLKNICLSLSQAWDDIVRKDNANDGRSQRNLSGVFVTRSIEALMEHGFILPEAGKDEEWLGQNIPEFQKRANEGDVEFQDLLQELGH